MLATLLCAVALQTQSTPPPFNRIWTHLVYGKAAVHRVQDDKVLFTGRSGAGVLNLQDGKPLWEMPLNWTTHGAATQSHVVCAFRPNEDLIQVSAFEISSGKEVTLYQGDTYVAGLAASDATVFILLADGSLSAIDPYSKSIRWETNINPDQTPSYGGGSLAFGNGALFAGQNDIGRFCIEPETGEIRWQYASRFAGLHAPVFLPQGVLTTDIPTALRDTTTGEIKWTAEHQFETVGVLGDLLVGEVQDELVGIDVESGKARWTKSGGDKGYTVLDTQLSLARGDKDTVWLITHAEMTSLFVIQHNLTAVSGTGEIKWNTPKPFAGTIIYQSPNLTLTQDDFRILAYEPASLQTWPLDPQKLQSEVNEWVKNWPNLDSLQRQHLATVKDQAFVPFLNEFLTWTVEAERVDQTKTEGVYDGKSFYYMWFIDNATNELFRLFTPSQTDHLIQTWKSLPNDHPAKPTLESLLNERADPKTYIPLLIHKVTNIEDIPDDQAFTVDVLSQSTHPDAVDFMIAALDNPKADPYIRDLAFTRLVGTGGVKGLEAVKRWRKDPRPITPWYERVDLDNISPRQHVAENTDSNGSLSILFTADYLANPKDLYYAQKSNGEWSRPYWTGLQRPSGAPGQNAKYQGFTIAEILAEKWVDLFANNPEIRKDSDQDGLTDMEEARLKTNPQNPDSDNDEMLDNADPVPSTASGQTLNDDQKIFAAVLEASNFAFPPKTCPHLIHFPEVTPFEFYGLGAPSLWQPESDPSTASFPQLRLSDPDYFSGKATDFKRIRYSEDKVSARTTLSYNRGSFAYGTYFDLKKIDDQWYVTNSQAAYIS